MIDRIIDILFQTSGYSTRTERLKATFMYTLISLLIILVIPIGFIGVSQGAIVSPLIPIIVILSLIAMYALVRSDQLITASWLFILVVAVSTIVNNVIDGEVGTLSLLINLLLLAIAGFLLQNRGIIFVVLISILQIFLLQLASEVGATDVVSKIPLSIIYIAMGVIIASYNRFNEASLLVGQDIESIERLKLADVNARITRQASTRANLETALNTTLDLILENYPDIYHAQVFLLDDDGIQAELVASTGDAGKKLMERSHKLAVGSLSVIGQTTFTGEPVIATTGEKDSVHRVNDLLPNTLLEAAFPLRVGDEIIGALDLQSTVLEALNANDKLTFQSLANSLSLAIDSIRQFEQARARVEENQRLTEQTRTALREVERLNQRLIGRAWSEYAKGLEDDLGYAVNFENEQTEDYTDWTATLADAVESNNLVQDGNIIAVPLRVRGQVIGAMEFELDNNQEFTPEDLDLITEVSERFGLAAENTRLVEESQRTAERETLINQITSRFQSAQNVEATLAEAARSLSETLSAENIKIRLGVPQSQPNGKEQ